MSTRVMAIVVVAAHALALGLCLFLGRTSPQPCTPLRTISPSDPLQAIQDETVSALELGDVELEDGLLRQLIAHADDTAVSRGDIEDWYVSPEELSLLATSSVSGYSDMPGD